MKLPSASTKLRKRAGVIFTVVALLWIADVAAMVMWTGRNPCLRSHTEVASHPDANGDPPEAVVCDWYKTDPGRNPWTPRNEFHTVKNLLTP
jgi:hypothetical protein